LPPIGALIDIEWTGTICKTGLGRRFEPNCTYIYSVFIVAGIQRETRHRGRIPLRGGRKMTEVGNPVTPVLVTFCTIIGSQLLWGGIPAKGPDQCRPRTKRTLASDLLLMIPSAQPPAPMATGAHVVGAADVRQQLPTLQGLQHHRSNTGGALWISSFPVTLEISEKDLMPP